MRNKVKILGFFTLCINKFYHSLEEKVVNFLSIFVSLFLTMIILLPSAIILSMFIFFFFSSEEIKLFIDEKEADES